MSAFTDFIQIELPLRPFLSADVPENSVLVRQGAGPRQMSAVTLGEGEIIMNIGGSLQAVLLDDVAGTTDSFIHTQETSSSTWNIQHNANTENFSLTVFDDRNRIVVPDEVTVVDANNVDVTFAQFPTSGRAVLVIIRE